VNERVDPDERLIAELRDLLGRTDPVPAEVTEFARAALGWRTLEADLAELLEDSVLESGALATTRSGAVASRRLGFRAADLSLDVELSTTEAGSRRLLGQLAPAPARATVEVQGLDGEVIASAETDALGRFRLELAPADRVRLLVQRPGVPPVATSWVSL
jgi:hypothetical protein